VLVAKHLVARHLR